MPMPEKDLYDPTTVDIDQLAELLLKLSPKQREALEIRLDPKAMRQLEESKRDLESDDTVPFEEW